MENFSKTGDYSWNIAFYEELSHQRKLALRMGELSVGESGFVLRPSVVNHLFRGDRTFESLNEDAIGLKEKVSLVKCIGVLIIIGGVIMIVGGDEE